MQANSTHFGFETVDSSEKTHRVRGVFDSVASHYDVMNDVMSLGMHRLWKREFVDSLNVRPQRCVLDLAGGTGDIATLIMRERNVDLTICDINAMMLTEGRKRAWDHNHTHLTWVCGNAESLPLPDQSFDYVTIAFGIRNVTDIPAALQEIFRVLKPGGQFACLEFSTVKAPLFSRIYDTYSFEVIPRVGGLIASDRQAYQYLVESIRRFPDQETFKQMIETAGFEQVRYRNLSAGIVAIHSGYRI